MLNKTNGRMNYFNQIINFKPDAVAYMKGSSHFSCINGSVYFYQTDLGTLVTADISGLPSQNPCGFFGFHVHEGTRCTGNSSDPFLSAGAHYNPANAAHPCHAGDMPPLLSNDGVAYMTFLTTRFTVEEVMGHVVIIHIDPDDFTTQPSGNSGEKIACGVIKPY